MFTRQIPADQPHKQTHTASPNFPPDRGPNALSCCAEERGQWGEMQAAQESRRDRARPLPSCLAWTRATALCGRTWSAGRDAVASGVATGPGASFALMHGPDPGDGNGVTFCHEIGI
jgi:hypothetical protein